ncbi:unnamed protein product [Prorocentrum cordatum]|uniref:Uncharacterized protein n=1 Tax=Prorocentrum cordatum TaxID=2364126 RepID=A0ABN9SKK1_9DINO|nr:unnamed protein product [Polarella glacialis]
MTMIRQPALRHFSQQEVRYPKMEHMDLVKCRVLKERRTLLNNAMADGSVTAFWGNGRPALFVPTRGRMGFGGVQRGTDLAKLTAAFEACAKTLQNHRRRPQD